MWEAAGRKDAGCVRANNEDDFALVDDLGLYVVADGMGGAQAGETASRLAIETVIEVMRSSPSRDSAALVEAIQQANRRLMSTASKSSKLEGMGTTLIAALTEEAGNGTGPSLFIASVGDSRAYVFRGGQSALVTDDQTWVNEIGRRLGLDEETLRVHPMRHVLTMAVGVSQPLRVNTYRVPMEPGATVLLCSDGLHGVVPDTTMAGHLGRPEVPLDRQCQELIEEARQAGGPDNITAVLLRVA